MTIDRATLDHRLDLRPAGEWGAQPSERELIQHLHDTSRNTPEGITIDATAPLTRVVDEILSRTALRTR